MPFGLKTKNIHHNVRKKNPIAGLEMDSAQLFIYTVAGVLLFFVVFYANISILWTIIISTLIILITLNITKKYDDSSINKVTDDYGRTFYEWFIIYIGKSINGNKSVDKGIDYSYYQKNNNGKNNNKG